MHKLFVSSLVLTLGFLGLVPAAARAEYVDLSISAASIRFSEDTLYAGESVRIYATIRNNGDVDTTAQVFFYKSDSLIGKSQPVSVLADGGSDDVFVDYTLPEGSFNIRAVIQGASPADTNPSNNEAVTPLFKSIADDDRDGVLNDQDNCVDADNLDQADLDGDGKGDACDNDLDNDGVINSQDDFPTDASKSKVVVEEPVAVVKDPPVVEPVVVKAEPVKSEPQTPAPVLQVEPSPVDEPTPEVQGLQDENVEPVEVALNLSGLGYGGPTASPAARFTFTQVSWNTYEFTALPPLGGEDYTFAWDFGDGATSVQANISHTFQASGVYTVTLATLNADGEVTSDSQPLTVSFFHFSNPLLLITVGVLLVILGGLLVLILRLRRGEEV